MSVCACAGTNITWKHYVLFAVRYQEKEGLAWPLTPWSLTLLNRVLLLHLQTAQVTYFCMKHTLHWLWAGWKNCFHVSMQSQWLALKTTQGIPVVERGQLFHHFVLKITVWKNSLNVDITFGVYNKITKRSTSDKQLPLNLTVVAMLPVQLNFTISFSKTKSCHLCHCLTLSLAVCGHLTSRMPVTPLQQTLASGVAPRKLKCGFTTKPQSLKCTDGFNSQYLILATLSCALP